ncbi:type VI secretion system Vgr family protein [Vibrio gazogenes]|uniref:Type VI secretion system secreted protein VgrG n=1 Tax=Vibrio gazogenes DSM 21264 = NBRC 103151 TaxID=1123492 RepID=A0A1M5EIT5_VIBGA|nr:type VI secretion system tip protein VgrG [Vibrio gazogenes]USP12529.1 type VI secretion system tip protein VgrG [Vibrio gazogenes]SHF79155.1 type VI secretion system secreted protein VgrG [Vibrio gazogenes DSM 21264] [Vibrio gazogenes DSM 21264 = NBRC 103151]SJN53997.1 Phage-related baseplate assembly protein [Vibrio gazogenes]
MATLGFRLTINGVNDASLVVRDYQGFESVSASVGASGHPVYGYRYHIELASRNSDLTFEQLVDTTALLEVFRNGQVVQKVHGIIRNFSRGDTGHHHTFYSLTLVPSLERLSLRHNSRIFQQKSVPQILSVLLQEMNITDYAFSTKRECPPREFCVQYRETDLEFFHRLAAEEGLMYYFAHEADKHTLVVTDNAEGFTRLGGTVPYNVLSGGVSETPYVSAMTARKQSEVSSVWMQDYSFKKPTYSFKQSVEASDLDYQLPNYEYYDAPGRYKDDASGKAFSQIRLDALRREAHTASGKSNQAMLQAGVRFDLSDHLDTAMNQNWLLVQVAHQGSQPQALEESGGSGATTYANQFTAIPGDNLWLSPVVHKPRVDGTMIATVVGPAGEEIYCDEHGRVKLHFPWDRESNGDEFSSCWVRVSQQWAGSQYGMVAVPRIGHEVIVDFLEGDPDQPLITGRAFNASHVPPYPLPANKTKTVLRTETHQGEGFNELSFEDQAESEQVYLHAQKDTEALIENDATTLIRHDSHLTVENDRYEHIKMNDHLTVDGEQRIKITQDQSHDIGGDLQQQIGSLTAVETGSAITLKSGAKIVAEAGSGLTLSAGGSFISIDSGSVNMSGAAINLNAGGSAGSAVAYGGKAALLPEEITTKPDNPAPILTPAQIATMKSAAPFCEECEKCKDGVCAI